MMQWDQTKSYTDLLIAIICSFVDSSFLQQETSKQQAKKIVIPFPLVR